MKEPNISFFVLTAVQEERGPRKNKGQRNSKSGEKNVGRAGPSTGLLCNREIAFSSMSQPSLSTSYIPFTNSGNSFKTVHINTLSDI